MADDVKTTERATAEHATMEHTTKEHATTEKDLIVPLVDEHEAGKIYDSSILRFALAGAIIGGVLLGVIGYLIAAGVWPVAGFGQFAAGGDSVGAFVGAGLGASIGGLAGALVALYKMPARDTQAERNKSE